MVEKANSEHTLARAVMPTISKRNMAARMPLRVITGILVMLSYCIAQKPLIKHNRHWTDSFDIERCSFASVGENPFFILKPGYRSEFIGIEGRDTTKLVITVLDETEMVGSVETRVVEEREMMNGELLEISLNYFAACQETNTIFYFGEAVSIYNNGKVVSREGAWRADAKNMKAGVMMPGIILAGSRYYQEIAPGIAMDRAEIVGMDEKVITPAGVFTQCLKIEETTPLEPRNKEHKYYARGVGLVRDGSLILVKYGMKQDNSQ